MNTKKTATLALIVSLIVAPMAQAAIPVYDPAAVAQAIKQVQNQVQQLEQMRAQLKAVTGNSGIGDLLKDPNVKRALEKYLPQGKDYSYIYDAIKRGDAGALQSIYEQALKDEQARQSQMSGKERLAIVMATNEAQVVAAIKTLDVRAQNATTLANQLSRTQNAAAKADLMNALNAEAAAVQIDMARFQLLIEQGKQQKERAEEQSANDYAKSAFR